jgi:DNA-binding NtrC family response regulator
MKSKRVLIAYPDDPWVQSFSRIFHGVGCRVETAKGVSELVRSVRGGAADVVILDDEMEGVKACELVPLIKKVNGTVQVIVISSEESLGPVRRLRGTGIFYQAMKPADPEEIRSAVECAFDKIERENLRPFFFIPHPQWVPV